MKTLTQIFDSEKPLVMTDTGSSKVYLFLNGREVTVQEPQGEDGEPQEVTKYEYDVAEITPVSKSDADVLAAVKQQVQADIEAYDKSDAVNQFFLNGMPMWVPDADRTKLAKRMNTDEQDGKTVTKVIYNHVAFTLPIAAARQMLQKVESYATACFDKTNEHILTVLGMTDVAAVLGYDYRAGYPEEKPSAVINPVTEP